MGRERRKSLKFDDNKSSNKGNVFIFEKKLEKVGHYEDEKKESINEIQKEITELTLNDYNDRESNEFEFTEIEKSKSINNKISRNFKSKLPGYRLYCPKKLDERTIEGPLMKGASCLLFGIRSVSIFKKNNIPNFRCKNSHLEIVVLLGKEKKGKYEGLYNLFGGHYEEIDCGSCSNTAKREFGEEFNPKYVENESLNHWIKWFGSPWAYNTTHIEFGMIHKNFNVDVSFKENEEMSDAKLFPIKNFVNAQKNDRNRICIEDIDGNKNEVSGYAHGVVSAAIRNRHFWDKSLGVGTTVW